MHTLRLTILLLSAALVGCAGLDATAERDLDRAAATLNGQLDEPGLLAATAVLYHAQHARYPTDAFALLGSAAARETGLQQLGLSALSVAPEAGGLTMRYTLLPSQDDPTDRFGTVAVAETDTSGTYTVDLVLERTADPDGAVRALPLTQEGAYAVIRAKGSLCADVETLRARAGRDVGNPPLDASTSYTVTFTSSDGSPAPATLEQGVTVTLPR